MQSVDVSGRYTCGDWKLLFDPKKGVFHVPCISIAGKILACLERSFQKGATATFIKGRDFYDLLWFMQQRIQPLEEKLEKDGAHSYTVQTAMQALTEKVDAITPRDLSMDLLPLFEQRTFIKAWIEAFHDNFREYVQNYLR